MRRYRGAARLAGVDVARALALFGMMSVHVFPPFADDGALHPAYAVAAGRSAALFAVLAGVGLALASGASRPPVGAGLRAARIGALARAALLLVLGLLLGDVDSPPLVILAYYAVLFAVAPLFLGLRARTLAILAAGWALLAPVASHLLRSGVEPATVGEPGGADLPVELVLTGTYPVLPWVTYLLAGLALGRLPLGSTRVAGWVAAGGGALAVAAQLVSGWAVDAAGGAARLAGDGRSLAEVEQTLEVGMFGTTPTSDAAWLLVAAPHSSTTLDLLHTTGTSALVLGGALLLTRRGAGLLLPLACTGSMTLTLYCLHVLALADGAPVPSREPLTVWLLHVAAALTLATVWRLLVGRGPLEALGAGLARAAGRVRVPA